MRRAALYAWNRGALVVVDDGPAGPVVVDSIDFEIGGIHPETLAAWVDRYEAGRLLVVEAFNDAGRPFPEASINLVASVSVLCTGYGVEIRVLSESSRKKFRGAATKLLPRGAGSEGARDALAMVLADVGPAEVSSGKTDPATHRYLCDVPGCPGYPWKASERPHTTCDDRTAATCGIPTRDGPGCGLPAGHEGRHRLPGSGPFLATAPGLALAEALCGPLPSGPRVAGIDPGERWIAVCVGAVPGPDAVNAVHSGTIPPPRAPTLRYVASLQVEIERTGKDQPTDEQLDAAVGKAVDFCELHGVERACVERAVNVHRAPGKSAEEGAGLAAYLLRGQYVAGMLRGALRAARREGGGPLIPGRVESVSSVKGRNHVRRLAGAGLGKDSPWAPRVREAFGGTIPAGAGEHVLDAAVAAVWATRPEEEPKAPARPRAPQEPGKPRQGGHGARAARKEAGRTAAGCRCVLAGKGARHMAGCPIKVAADAKRAGKMAGNGNARKERRA